MKILYLWKCICENVEVCFKDYKWICLIVVGFLYFWLFASSSSSCSCFRLLFNRDAIVSSTLSVAMLSFRLARSLFCVLLFFWLFSLSPAPSISVSISCPFVAISSASAAISWCLVVNRHFWLLPQFHRLIGFEHLAEIPEYLSSLPVSRTDGPQACWTSFCDAGGLSLGVLLKSNRAEVLQVVSFCQKDAIPNIFSKNQWILDLNTWGPSPEILTRASSPSLLNSIPK